MNGWFSVVRGLGPVRQRSNSSAPTRVPRKPPLVCSAPKEDKDNTSWIRMPLTERAASVGAASKTDIAQPGGREWSFSSTNEHAWVVTHTKTRNAYWGFGDRSGKNVIKLRSRWAWLEHGNVNKTRTTTVSGGYRNFSRTFQEFFKNFFKNFKISRFKNWKNVIGWKIEVWLASWVVPWHLD